MATEQRFEGSSLEEVLAQVKDTFGSDADIISANKIRPSGVGAVFGRERFEVIAKPRERGAKRTDFDKASRHVDPIGQSQRDTGGRGAGGRGAGSADGSGRGAAGGAGFGARDAGTAGRSAAGRGAAGRSGRDDVRGGAGGGPRGGLGGSGHGPGDGRGAGSGLRRPTARGTEASNRLRSGAGQRANPVDFEEDDTFAGVPKSAVDRAMNHVHKVMADMDRRASGGPGSTARSLMDLVDQMHDDHAAEPKRQPGQSTRQPAGRSERPNVPGRLPPRLNEDDHPTTPWLDAGPRGSAEFNPVHAFDAIATPPPVPSDYQPETFAEILDAAQHGSEHDEFTQSWAAIDPTTLIEDAEVIDQDHPDFTPLDTYDVYTRPKPGDDPYIDADEYEDIPDEPDDGATLHSYYSERYDTDGNDEVVFMEQDPPYVGKQLSFEAFMAEREAIQAREKAEQEERIQARLPEITEGVVVRGHDDEDDIVDEAQVVDELVTDADVVDDEAHAGHDGDAHDVLEEVTGDHKASASTVQDLLEENAANGSSHEDNTTHGITSHNDAADTESNHNTAHDVLEEDTADSSGHEDDTTHATDSHNDAADTESNHNTAHDVLEEDAADSSGHEDDTTHATDSNNDATNTAAHGTSATPAHDEPTSHHEAHPPKDPTVDDDPNPSSTYESDAAQEADDVVDGAFASSTDIPDTIATLYDSPSVADPTKDQGSEPAAPLHEDHQDHGNSEDAGDHEDEPSPGGYFPGFATDISGDPSDDPLDFSDPVDTYTIPSTDDIPDTISGFETLHLDDGWVSHEGSKRVYLSPGHIHGEEEIEADRMNRLIDWLATNDLDRPAIAKALEGLPRLEDLPSVHGVVMAIVGEGFKTLPLARRIATELSIDPAEVLLASARRGHASVPDNARLTNTIEAHMERRSWRRSTKPTIIAIDTSFTLSRVAQQWANDMLEALEPHQVIGLIDAGRKIDDIARWITLIGGVDAIALAGIDETASPQAVLELGLPVARLGSQVATPSSWAELLYHQKQK